MIGQRYSIEVSENCVEIQGTLCIREAFDFLAFFEREGFTQLIPGDQNSCMYLYKKDPEDAKPAEPPDTFMIDEVMSLTKERNELKLKVKELEDLVKQVLQEYKRPKEEITDEEELPY